MSKSEIQSLAPFYLCILNVCVPFLFGHGVPDPVPPPILVYIVGFGSKENKYDHDIDDHEIGVSSSIFGLIVISIDKIGANIACLDGHLTLLDTKSNNSGYHYSHYIALLTQSASRHYLNSLTSIPQELLQ